MGPELRIIDANANRAREAARVMEDVARFVLNDQPLSSGMKALRHELRQALEWCGFEAARLATWRDTPGDVGTTLATGQELSRGNIAEVAIAAGKRLGEALRVLEELTKVGSARRDPGGTDGPANPFKPLRYRGYELERRLVMMLGSGRARQWRLCVLITESLCGSLGWRAVAERSLAGGADCLQLREKSLPDAELLERARWLVGLARTFHAPGKNDAPNERRADIIINDRPDIALLAGADGVHVGQYDLSVEAVRRLAGRSLLVGVSTENLAQARAAAAAGADSCGVGPMFVSATKDKARIAGSAYLREYLAEFGVSPPEGAPRRYLPHLAIGGITPGNIRELALAGCRGVAVAACVCGSADPERTCRELIECLAGSTRIAG